MRKGSKKTVPQLPKPYDYETSFNGEVKMVEGSKNYYSGQDLTAEAKSIITEYGFKLKELFKTKWGRTYKELQTYEKKYTTTNLYRYFGEGKSAVTIPNDALLDMINYMKKLGEQIQDESKKYTYLDKVNVLAYKVSQYCMENGLFESMLKELISRLKKGQLEEFFKALPVIKYDERAWRFWLCYTVLNRNGRAKVDRLLSVCIIPTLESLRILHGIYSLQAESDIELYSKVHKSFEKYGNDMEGLRQELSNIATSYVEHYGSKRNLYRRVSEIVNFGVEIAVEDWSLLFTYAHLISDWDKFSDVEEFLIKAMEQEEEYLQKDCPKELATYFQKQYQEIIDERKEAEFEQFLLYNEETKYPSDGAGLSG